MNGTPRTDNCKTDKHGYVPTEFARNLERENNRLFEALEGVLHSGTSNAFAHGQHVLEQCADASNRQS